MSETRICPVCENEIPADARFLCPHRHFELKWLDDDREVERAKQAYTSTMEKNDINLNIQKKKLDLFFLVYFLTGSIGAIISLVALEAVFWGGSSFDGLFEFSICPGVLSLLIIKSLSKIENKYNKVLIALMVGMIVAGLFFGFMYLVCC